MFRMQRVKFIGVFGNLVNGVINLAMVIGEKSRTKQEDDGKPGRKKKQCQREKVEMDLIPVKLAAEST